MEWAEENTEDTEKNIKLDAARDYDLAGHAAQVKFGGKLSRRDKSNDTDIWTYEDLGDFGFSDEQLGMDQFTKGTVDYSLDRFGPGLSADRIEDLIGGLDRSEFFNEEESRVNDFDMSEDINAAYLMHTLDIDDLRIITGLRYEGTEFEAKGTGIRDGDYESIEAQQRLPPLAAGLARALPAGTRTPRCVPPSPTAWCGRPSASWRQASSSTATRPASATRRSTRWESRN